MKRTAPSTARNREPILNALRKILFPGARVLEIASGTGEHAVHIARALPGVDWQPTELSRDGLDSIEAWRSEAGLPNLRQPVLLDVTSSIWPFENVDVVFCSNMIHIAPWEATLGLVAGADRVLRRDGCLVLYGPFFRADVETAPSNVAFDASLRAQNPAWGVRSLEAVTEAAARHALVLDQRLTMPSNNLVVIFRRS